MSYHNAFPRNSFLKRFSPKKRLFWGCSLFLGGALLLLLSSPLCPPGEASSEVRQRWIAPYWAELPLSWKPLVQRRDGVLFFSGAGPHLIDRPEGENLPLLALMIRKQPAPEGGGYEDFIREMERQSSKEEAKNFTSHREDVLLGDLPAVWYSFSGEARMGDVFRKMGGTLIVTKEPDAEGLFTLAVLMGTSEAAEEQKDALRAILASLRKGVPPLDLQKSFPYGATPEAFRHTFGLAWASDGIFALGDATNCRIRLFDAEGMLLEEWGEKGRGEDGTLSFPQDVVFAPDGSLWVLEEGDSVQARLQRFSRKGEFLQKIDLSPKVMGEKGIYKPSFVRVTDSGKIVVFGFSDTSDGKERILVFTPSGELLAAWEPGEGGGLASLPGDRVLLFQENPETDRSPLFCVYDLQGKRLAQWSFYGTDLPSTPGDEEIYFSPRGLATDGAGNIYVFDDSEKALWIYDAEGRLLQVLSVSEHFGIFMGMTASPTGDVVVQDRPAGYGMGEPSLHILKNTFLTSSSQPSEKMISEDSPIPPPLPVGEVPVLGTPVAEPPPGKPEGEKALREELARLKKALALREQALVLEKGGDLGGAAALYRESLPLHPDSAVEAYAAALEQAQSESALPGNILEKASGIVASPNLALSGEIPEISKKQEEGPEEKPEKVLEEKPEEATLSLESLLAKPSEAPELPEPPQLPELLQKSLLPASPYEEAEKLEAEGRRYEALLKYQEILREKPDPAMQTHARELESALRREARQMVTQAVAVQNRGEYREALRLYRESLDIFPLEQVKEYADRLEILLHQGAQSQEVRAKAESLWREGAALEKNWRYQEALAKYKEGLALSPDPKVEEHVKKLEAFLAGRSN